MTAQTPRAPTTRVGLAGPRGCPGPGRPTEIRLDYIKRAASRRQPNTFERVDTEIGVCATIPNPILLFSFGKRSALTYAIETRRICRPNPSRFISIDRNRSILRQHERVSVVCVDRHCVGRGRYP